MLFHNSSGLGWDLRKLQLLNGLKWQMIMHQPIDPPPPPHPRDIAGIEHCRGVKTLLIFPSSGQVH